MEKLGITNYLVSDTLYGDWSCATLKGIKGAKCLPKKIGEFCADAGMVAVFVLDEVLAYNPGFDYHLTKPHTTTLITNFTGNVNIVTENDEVYVVGKGNINFYTKQTGC